MLIGLLADSNNILYDHNLYRLFLPQVRDVLDARITLCAERVDIHPILAFHHNSLNLAIHVAILDIREHTLEDAEVHPRADALQ